MMSGGWYIDYGVHEEPPHRSTEFIWPPDRVDDDGPVFTNCSMVPADKSTCSWRKRNREESSAEPSTKARREKMRRDRLNDRFYELASILKPSTPPTSDKVAILNDATRRLNQLRLKLQHIKQSNDSLLENIKKAKAEKTELRDVKARLKAEKAKMEHILKITTTTAFIPHPPVDPAAYKTTYPNCPTPVAMWQWIPPAVMDTSQDHALRPPVA